MSLPSSKSFSKQAMEIISSSYATVTQDNPRNVSWRFGLLDVRSTGEYEPPTIMFRPVSMAVQSANPTGNDGTNTGIFDVVSTCEVTLFGDDSHSDINVTEQMFDDFVRSCNMGFSGSANNQYTLGTATWKTQQPSLGGAGYRGNMLVFNLNMLGTLTEVFTIDSGSAVIQSITGSLYATSSTGLTFNGSTEVEKIP